MAGVKGRSGGQNAKSRAQHKLEGTYQPCRHGGFTNPDPPLGVPEQPVLLEGEALAEWDRMLTRLTRNKSLSVVDDAALFQYCRLFAETEALADARERTTAGIQVLEETLKDRQADDLVPVCQELTKLRKLESQYANQIRQGRLAVMRFLAEFGLTPASRGRVTLPEQEPEDEFAQFDGVKVADPPIATTRRHSGATNPSTRGPRSVSRLDLSFMRHTLRSWVGRRLRRGGRAGKSSPKWGRRSRGRSATGSYTARLGATGVRSTRTL